MFKRLATHHDAAPALKAGEILLGTFPRSNNTHIKIVPGGKDKVTGKPARNVIVQTGSSGSQVIIRGLDPKWDARKTQEYLKRNYAHKFDDLGGIEWANVAHAATDDTVAADHTAADFVLYMLMTEDKQYFMSEDPNTQATTGLAPLSNTRAKPFVTRDKGRLAAELNAFNLRARNSGKTAQKLITVTLHA